jgi:lipoic acid synthetase
MILGDICTRACRFCATSTGKPLLPDPEEPMKLAESIKTLQLKHCVITSVDRDDLPDKGSGFWATTVKCIKEVNPGTTIETLIPDFDGKTENIRKVIESGPEVISHNIETVRRMTPLIRTRAKYETSLGVLEYISGYGKRTKSGLMLGLGENEDEIIDTMDDLLKTGCRILTIGQYLQPSLNHMKPVSYTDPEKFEEYREIALAKGFEFAECFPLVRSSFHAEKHVSAGLI